jgi:molecular chaperone GrpE
MCATTCKQWNCDGAFVILRLMKQDDEMNDVDFEPEDEMGTVGAVKVKMEKLRDELEKAKAERQEYLDGWQRCKADSINARKDLLVTAERQGERAKERLIEEIIPALDGFDLAAGSPAWELVDAGWRSGIDQIRNQLLDVLSRHGVERYGRAGEKFDHVLHEAVEERDDMPGQPGEILRILRYGYKMGQRIIRPAQVIVKK